jgi:hypothetical protein
MLISHGQGREGHQSRDVGIVFASGDIVGDVEAEKAAKARNESETDGRDCVRRSADVQVEPWKYCQVDLHREMQTKTISFFQMGIFRGSITPSVSPSLPRRLSQGNPTLGIGSRGGNVDDRSGGKLDGAADADLGLRHPEFIVDRLDVLEVLSWNFVHDGKRLRQRNNDVEDVMMVTIDCQRRLWVVSMEGWPSAKHLHIPEKAGMVYAWRLHPQGFCKASAARQCLVEIPCSGAVRCLPRTLGCGRPLSRVASKGLACCVGPNPMGKRGVLGSPRGWNSGNPGSDPARGGRRRITTHGTDAGVLQAAPRSCTKLGKCVG